VVVGVRFAVLRRQQASYSMEWKVVDAATDEVATAVWMVEAAVKAA
jgi:hypothetical protein